MLAIDDKYKAANLREPIQITFLIRTGSR